MSLFCIINIFLKIDNGYTKEVNKNKNCDLRDYASTGSEL